ncbi:hypothetical protein RhiJN_26933 [Ceratobasidium sp. AG-Ba]|nr:hypothetical protein RhiJN_26933 [Ceratobasidium sp. AG-Ba]
MQRTQKIHHTIRLVSQRRSLASIVRTPGAKQRYTVPSAKANPLLYSRLTSTQFATQPRVPFSATWVVSQRRSYSSGVTEDEERKGLFYHTLDGGVYALSFLSESPSSQNSATVIGLIPEGQGLEGFQENQAFVDLLHDTVKSALIENVDPDLANDATQRQEGWMHVHDLRRFPESGRVGDADDIIGTVLVQEGKINGETYERMPMYRTVSSDGPTKLSESLHKRLLSALQDAHKKESKA